MSQGAQGNPLEPPSKLHTAKTVAELIFYAISAGVMLANAAGAELGYWLH